MSESEKHLPSLYSSIEELLSTAKKANNRRVGDFNINNRSLAKKSKGSIGQIVEEGVFHYSVNSRAESDFSNLGIELKVTGLKKLKNNRFVMKERLVLNVINYCEEAMVDFEHSSFWNKNKRLLIMFYLYEKNLKDANYLILESSILDYIDKDLEIIKSDWELIHKKILLGQAHNISEADTMYLAACTKGKDSNTNYRNQPYSDIKARQRAYCFKASYMNVFVDKIFNNETYNQALDFEEIKGNSFAYSLKSKLSAFFGQSEKSLLNKFGIINRPKSLYHILCAKMLGINGNINNTEEFKKANIVLKAIRVEENNSIQQHMSFPYFIYTKLITQEWEKSDIFKILYTTKFLFVIFKKKGNEYHLKDIVLWNMPYEDINNFVRPVFEHTKMIISKGEIISNFENGRYKTNFYGSNFNHVCHVRPHDAAGINKTKKGLMLPVPDKKTGLTSYTKYCFWLDKNYILKILKENNAV